LADRSLDSSSAWRLDTFHSPPGTLGSRAVVLDGPEGHHLVNVVRSRPGDLVRLIDGDGGEALGRIESAEASRARISILERRTHSRRSGVDLTLVQGLLKGRGMSDVVRRTAELGVGGIVPVTTERAVGRVREGAGADRISRWRGIALSALKQSRGVFLTRIEGVRDLRDVGPLVAAADVALVAWEEERGATLRERLASFDGPPASILLIVGPEGGLSPTEVGLLTEAGARSVSVGRRVLRADWAGPAIAGMIACQVGGLLP